MSCRTGMNDQDQRPPWELDAPALSRSKSSPHLVEQYRDCEPRPCTRDAPALCDSVPVHSLMPEHAPRPHSQTVRTLFLAGLPYGTPATAELENALKSFLGRWAPVLCVKLVRHSGTSLVKCAFAEFAESHHASTVAAHVRTEPFRNVHLRIEEARADRTLRFSPGAPNDLAVHLDHIWIRTAGQPGGPVQLAPYCPMFPIFSSAVTFSSPLIEDLASIFGAVERILEGIQDHVPYVEVVYAQREGAFTALRELASLPPSSNLKVQWPRSHHASSEYTFSRHLQPAVHPPRLVSVPAPVAMPMPMVPVPPAFWLQRMVPAAPAPFAYLPPGPGATMHRAVPMESGKSPYEMPKYEAQTVAAKSQSTPPPRNGKSDAVKPNALWIGSISSSVTRAELLSVFEPFGEVTELWLSGQGWASITFVDEASAKAAHAAVNNKRLHTRNIVVRERRPRKGVGQGKKSDDST